jgi:hypothetical protein
MGCAVALYEQQTKHLLCPCHQSTFDVTRAAKVIFGPAARPLPQLAITVDSEGYLVAQNPFNEPVGPSFLGALSMTARERIAGTVANYVDERTGAAKWMKKNLTKVFPDHWSFLLGEIALYSFVILLLSGTFLTFWFDPSQREVVYDGSYVPLQGIEMSAAYASALDISFEVRGGLLMRQIHHWSALIFMAAIVVHLMRVYFTGAFRKPREFNWIIGIDFLPSESLKASWVIHYLTIFYLAQVFELLKRLFKRCQLSVLTFPSSLLVERFLAKPLFREFIQFTFYCYLVLSWL